MLYVIATIAIEPGSRADVLAAANPCIEATRQEDGCISYDLTASLTDTDTLIFVERWRDREALNAHFHQPHMKAWRAAGGPYIKDRKIEIIQNGEVETL